MKRIISFLLLVIFYQAHAQTAEKITYYYQGRKLSFPVNNTRIVIQLKAGETTDRRKLQLSSILHIPDTAIKSMAGAKLVTVKLAAGLTSTGIKALAASLNSRGFADFVHPCFTSSYGKDMAYGEGLVVKLKKNTSFAVFNNLLQQASCTIIKKYPFVNEYLYCKRGPGQ